MCHVRHNASPEFHAISKNWLGEPSGRKRPSVLLLGSLGVSASSLSDVFGFGGNSEAILEYGAGLDYEKRYELFYSTESALDGSGLTPWLISGRYFFARNFFAEVSGGSVTYGGYYTGGFIGPLGAYQAAGWYVPETHSPVFGVGAGWAGDYTYLILHFLTSTQELTRYSGDLPSSDYYHLLDLSYGICLRF